MNGSVFLDTNILVYSYSASETTKRMTAQNLIIDGECFISTQALQELTNIITKKFKYSYENAANVIEECCKNCNLTINSKDTISLAIQIASRYKFSFYDSLIISSALECECSILYSEDLQHRQIINKTLKIVNPFL